MKQLCKKMIDLAISAVLFIFICLCHLYSYLMLQQQLQFRPVQPVRPLRRRDRNREDALALARLLQNEPWLLQNEP